MRRWIRGQGYVDDTTRAPSTQTSAPISGLNIGDYERLLQSLGVSGGNPARPLDRWSQVLQGMRAIQQGQYSLGLEPLRQGTLSSFIQNLNPANIQARLDAVSRQNRSAAARNYEQMSAMAPSLGVSPASLASFYANADRNTAEYGQQARSPQGIQSAYQGMLGAIGAAQSPELAQLLSQLQGNMQQSNVTAKPKQPNGMAGLLGGLGQIAGMGGFGGASTPAFNPNMLNGIKWGWMA